MYYDDLQVRALNALELVPWVLHGTIGPSAAPVSVSGPVISADQVTPAVDELAVPLPAAAEALSHWLPQQAIMPEVASPPRDHEGEGTGAGLLVLFECSGSQSVRSGASGVPAGPERSIAGSRPSGLSQDGFRLFEAMMRSIDLTQRDLTLATLSPQPLPDGETVADLLATPHRAVLLMVQESAAASSAAGWTKEAGFTLEAPRLNGWRCPHPDLLLHEPLRKRDAWQVLKAVRRALAAGTS